MFCVMTIYVTCSNEMRHMSKKIELVISLKDINFIKLSNGAQPTLFDTEHARGRKFQIDKIAFEVRGHAST